jgi:flagellar protein FlbD
MMNMMIEVHRLNGTRYWINPHQIETITVNPDVTLTMLSGKAVVVKDKPEAVIQKIIAYRRQIGAYSNED